MDRGLCNGSSVAVRIMNIQADVYYKNVVKLTFKLGAKSFARNVSPRR